MEPFMPLLAGMGTGESELSEDDVATTLRGDSSGQEFGKAPSRSRRAHHAAAALGRVSDLNSEQIPAVLEHLGTDKEEEQMKGLKKLTDNVVLNADATQVHLLAQRVSSSAAGPPAEDKQPADPARRRHRPRQHQRRSGRRRAQTVRTITIRGSLRC